MGLSGIFLFPTFAILVLINNSQGNPAGKEIYKVSGPINEEIQVCNNTNFVEGLKNLLEKPEIMLILADLTNSSISRGVYAPYFNPEVLFQNILDVCDSEAGKYLRMICFEGNVTFKDFSDEMYTALFDAGISNPVSVLNSRGWYGFASILKNDEKLYQEFCQISAPPVPIPNTIDFTQMDLVLRDLFENRGNASFQDFKLNLTEQSKEMVIITEAYKYLTKMETSMADLYKNVENGQPKTCPLFQNITNLISKMEHDWGLIFGGIENSFARSTGQNQMKVLLDNENRKKSGENVCHKMMYCTQELVKDQGINSLKQIISVTSDLLQTIAPNSKVAKEYRDPEKRACMISKFM